MHWQMRYMRYILLHALSRFTMDVITGLIVAVEKIGFPGVIALLVLAILLLLILAFFKAGKYIADIALPEFRAQREALAKTNQLLERHLEEQKDFSKDVFDVMRALQADVKRSLAATEKVESRLDRLNEIITKLSPSWTI